MINFKNPQSNFQIFKQSNTDAGNILRIIETDVHIYSSTINIIIYSTGIVDFITALFSLVFGNSTNKYCFHSNHGDVFCVFNQHGDTLSFHGKDSTEYVVELDARQFVLQCYFEMKEFCHKLECLGLFEEANFMKILFGLYNNR